MAITKILARKGCLDVGIRYVLNEDKTQEQILTTRLDCDPGHECRQILETKRAAGKESGVQCYHLIQFFQPGEVAPELMLEIVREFAEEHLPGYQTVIGVHVDKEHIHAHILFNSVNADTGEKYHSNAQSYYRQIWAISDRLCRERDLSALSQGESTQVASHIERLRRSRGQSTSHSTLEEDLRIVIVDANGLGHLFPLVEHRGYETSHGSRLDFRLRGQGRFVIPGRKNPLFIEDDIRAAIQGNLAAIEAGRRPVVQLWSQYRSYQKYPRYVGLLALYAHYLCPLGKTGKRQYSPHMTPQLRQEVMRFEQYREQFASSRGNGIATRMDMAAFTACTEETLANLMKQRTVLNARRKRCRTFYIVSADVEALAPVKEFYKAELPGMETEFAQYTDAVAVLEQCDVPRERLIQEKAEPHERLAELNRQIRAERRKLVLCRKIQNSLSRMEQEINKAEACESEMRTNEYRRR